MLYAMPVYSVKRGLIPSRQDLRNTFQMLFVSVGSSFWKIANCRVADTWVKCEKVKVIKISYEYISVRVRLGINGETSSTNGYVEGMGSNGTWGGICDDEFGINDAHVVCRMLGYPSAIKALTDGTANVKYGPAPSGNSFVLEDLGCAGNETSIFDCPHDGEWKSLCTADEIAGVQCNVGKLYQIL